MKTENMNPFVRQAITAEMNAETKNYVYSELRSADCRLFYIISGCGEMSFNGEKYPLYAGTVILFPSGTEYMWCIEGVKYHAINFDYTQNFTHMAQSFHIKQSSMWSENDILETIVFEDAPELNQPVIIHKMTKLEETFRFIITEFYLNTEFCKPLISATLKALILRILSEKRGNTAKKDNNPDRIRSIIEYIALNYDKEITNTKIAEEFCYNPSYINRVFRENTGMGIHEFLINYRINSAIELLSNKNLSVFAVALSVGFTDISHFSKMFKKKTGKSPADYRKNM